MYRSKATNRSLRIYIDYPSEKYAQIVAHLRHPAERSKFRSITSKFNRLLPRKSPYTYSLYRTITMSPHCHNNFLYFLPHFPAQWVQWTGKSFAIVKHESPPAVITLRHLPPRARRSDVPPRPCCCVFWFGECLAHPSPVNRGESSAALWFVLVLLFRESGSESDHTVWEWNGKFLCCSSRVARRALEARA